MPNEIITPVPPGSDLYALALRLRREVFVHEQQVPAELEYDHHDLTARHFVSLVEGDVVATLRVILLDEHDKISRFAVRRSFRGRGVGRRLLEHVIAMLAAEGRTRQSLEAQVSAIGFYERLGFTAYGEVYQDAGIDHRRMVNYPREER
ncbi:putative N-acetyltransferase YjcF [Posidoniimonas polymericola]|uniref:Putative N-acetyltransferase YjcF n=1 Tax=Posidoniimonas polymericola TaxID=2528002 RepID=A0A5C5XVY4_9BACT|nr:GNAT family N-acetyltransferase [Posidoniimonas polymericola]TWT66858.1 putative N-acetyltransferase YjcF [Posidoniimonas polymericola]